METNETQQGEFSVQVEAIGKEILYVARNELYLKMRFMDVAFSSLRFSMDPEIQNIGTDGEMIWFHPAWLGGAYREDRRRSTLLHLVGRKQLKTERQRPLRKFKFRRYTLCHVSEDFRLHFRKE